MSIRGELQQIKQQLTLIERKIDRMSETQTAFDAQLSAFMADLQTQLTAINTACQAIIDKIAASGAPIDLSAESAQLTQAQAAIDSIAANLPTTLTAPPPGGGGAAPSTSTGG